MDFWDSGLRKTGFLHAVHSKQWTCCRLRLELRESLVEITVTKDVCCFRLIQGMPVTIFVYGREYQIKTEVKIPLEEW